MMSQFRHKVVDMFGMSCFVNATTHNLSYTIGERTKKVPRSAGIFVFDTIENAASFRRKFNRGGWRILKVKPVGRGKRLRWRPTSFNKDVLRRLPSLVRSHKTFVSNIFDRRKKDWNDVPDDICEYLEYVNDGTIVYDAVDVICEVNSKGKEIDWGKNESN